MILHKTHALSAALQTFLHSLHFHFSELVPVSSTDTDGEVGGILTWLNFTRDRRASVTNRI